MGGRNRKFRIVGRSGTPSANKSAGSKRATKRPRRSTTPCYRKERLPTTPSISHSGLALFDRDPELFAEIYIYRTAERPAPTPAMQWGTNAEAWIFRGELPDAAIIPDGLDRQTAAFRAWKMQHPGKRALTHDEARKHPKYSDYYRLTDRLQANGTAAEMIWGPDVARNVQVDWIDDWTRVERHGEIDLVRAGQWIADYKTSSTVDPDAFIRQAIDLRYHWQAAEYQDAIYYGTGKHLPWYWIVQRNKGGFGVEVIEAREDLLQQARWEYRVALRRYQRCLAAKSWSSPTRGSIISMGLPWYEVNGPLLVTIGGEKHFVR